MSFEPRNTLQEHTSKRAKKVRAWLLTLGRGRSKKILKDQPMAEVAKNTPSVCHGSKDTQHNSHQRWKISTHGREDEIINLGFTHDSAKLFNSEV